MSRRHSAEKREINPDPKFGNLVVSKFMNSIMYAGKKSVAEAIVYGALDIIENKTKQNPISVFEQALDNGGEVLYRYTGPDGHGWIITAVQVQRSLERIPTSSGQQ